MKQKTDEGRYKIQNANLYSPHLYYAGCLLNGHQVLMGVKNPKLVMIEFDADGNYLQTITRDEIHNSVLPRIDPVKKIEEWQAEIGFIPSTILIKRFSLPDLWIGIEDLPSHYQEFLNSRDSYSAEDCRNYQEQINIWEESGDFVLFWDEDYHLNREGEIESS